MVISIIADRTNTIPDKAELNSEILFHLFVRNLCLWYKKAHDYYSSSENRKVGAYFSSFSKVPSKQPAGQPLHVAASFLSGSFLLDWQQNFICSLSCPVILSSQLNFFPHSGHFFIWLRFSLDLAVSCRTFCRNLHQDCGPRCYIQDRPSEHPYVS